MTRLLTSGCIAIALIFTGVGCWAQELALQPYSYHESFEGEMPGFEQWATNGTHTVNFIGITDEAAYEGNKSLKLDVTLDSGSYHYWGVRLRVPMAGRLKLSARIRVAEGNTAGVSFGTNAVYPPTHHSGCGGGERLTAPMAEWRLEESDLVERGKTGAAGVMGNYTATVTGDDVGAYLDRWAVFVYGGEGTRNRAVVYIDDIRIEGEVPTEPDYDAFIARRWAVGQERLQTQLAGWRTEVAEARKSIEGMPEAPAALREAAERVKAGPDKADALLDAFARRGYGNASELAQIQEALFAARYGPATIAAAAAAVEAGQPYLLYGPPAITNNRLTADTFPIPAPLAESLSCSGCAGEYESMSVAIYALEALDAVTVEVNDLTGDAGTIPASAVDVHVVKSWFQAGRGIGDRSHKQLAPELLLKDDDLVRVDLEAGENHLRSTAENGTHTYLLCSGPTSENLEGVRPIDAETLQPVNIAENTLKQFWFTVQVPEDAAAGEYAGSVVFTFNGTQRSLPLRLTVHPFELLPSRLTYSIYYRAKLSADGQPTITSERRSEEQYRAEIADMKAHGVLYPTNYQGYDEPLIRRVLDIRQEVGMPTERFYNLGRSTGSTTDPEQLVALAHDVKKWIALCDEYGYGEVYFYGIDEAKGERLAAQKATWGAVQDAGGKTFVACYHGTFEAMGSLLNCAVLAHRPDPAEAAKWHGVGSEAFTYAYPQVGVEEPETYRRNFGLVLWKAGFDGAMDYAYQHGFGHVWNDFDSSNYRDHNFTYPTVNGVVGTLAWEGFREAVDDVRYVTTLEAAIKASDDADAAKQAQAWLDALEPDTADLYETRARMVEWIGRLK